MCEFIKATVGAVKLNRVRWIDPALASFEIRHYASYPFTNISTKYKIKFKLGLEMVKAEDDGRVSLAFNIPNLTPVVLSVEVYAMTLFIQLT